MDVVETVDRRPVPRLRKALYLLGAIAAVAGVLVYLELTAEPVEVSDGTPEAGVGGVLGLAGTALLTLCIYALVVGAVEAAVRSVQLRRELARRRAAQDEAQGEVDHSPG